ncbi:putative multidrug resistance-associated protein [Aspergillus heteromorphus CBS 117.55]|uniref:Putative multidrug resistance-associated protein n=1 Tax=Aspergillus heteromorphus CBS 117.55 TaxID=1448321 RepID=A0A317VFR2_9EURO|nr:putative multidrug resistance-associated protein [Aspergillus heteromorphus CBS 117.55]PWY72279.1 putative multidrug resistance-associated protein [Aspergillus heteromorphus CBS 117.55]
MASSVCLNSDNQFGPRVDPDCRPFDFTLLFEDAFFAVLPAALLILLLPARLQLLRRAPVKVTTYRLAICKSICVGTLFVLQVVYAVNRLKTAALHTKLATTSDVLSIIATAAAACLSFVEDQHSIEPSDLLVVYFSALTLLDIPRLRSLWLIPDTDICRGLWTAIYILTVVALFLESMKKLKILRSLYQDVTKEQVIGFWGRSFFIWVTPLFRAGFSDILSVEDLPETDKALQGDIARQRLENAWVDCKPSRRLLKAVFHAYLWPVLSAVVPRLALSGFTFCQPFLIASTIGYFEDGSTDDIRKYGRALVGAYLLVYLGIAISTAVYWRQAYRLITTVRAGLISMIYQQTTRLTSNDVKDTAALTLMGTDVERICTSFRLLHETWASVIEVAIALYLLERQIFLVCLVPAGITVACILGTRPISSRTGPAQKAWVGKVQTRIAATSAMLGDMKAVQMLGLTDVLFGLITKLRQAELATSSHFRRLFISMVVISNIPLDFAPYATFAVYAIISVVRNDQSLLASRAFTSLSLISLLTSPLVTFIRAVPQLVQCSGSFERIEAYLEKKPAVVDDLTPSSVASTDLSPREGLELTRFAAVPQASTLVSFNGVDIAWSPDSDTVLRDLHLDIGRGITMLIGPVGSGKSALIESILGETVIRNGTRRAGLSNVAYCSQKPWIVNNTIQHNITGGTRFDMKWYRFCVSACGLDDDLASLPAGDMHVAGSDGVSLSGGQKQRVALARAMYSRLPNILLDDVFSGLDSRCIGHIISTLFAPDGHFRKAGTSVILATHTQRLLPYADEIIVLDQGAVVDSGAYRDIISRTPDIAAKCLTLPGSEENVDSDRNTELEKAVATKATHQQNQPSDRDFSRRDGTWDVYKYYARSAGYKMVFGFVASSLVSTFLKNFSTIWIQWWSDSNETDPNGKVGFYLGVYTAFAVLNATGIAMACYLLFMKIINDTAMGLHTDLLASTLNAPMSFFQTTDTGSVTNRFSQDMDLIDMNLPICVMNTFGNGTSTIMKLIIICVVGKYMAATFPILVLAFFIIQSYYLRTSRQVRLLDIEAKSPLYSHFTETMKGISTIRALGWQLAFQTHLQTKLNHSQRPFYMLFCIQQWLALVLNLVVTAMAVILLAIITSMKDKFSAAAIGVALNMVLTFNQEIVRTVQSWTQLETSIGAVSRVQNFMRETPSERNDLMTPLPPVHEWPSDGAITFENITAVHGSPASQTTPILKNISLEIRPREKLAICGPSGSGKTSLIMALLQMIDIQEGRVSIDGRDLATFQPKDIRLRLNIIPQDPFFMPGSVRFNLDPHVRATDETIQSAVEKVGLWRRVGGAEGLDMDLKAEDWSMGERQLLALARALVVGVTCPVLVLDEAMSSVDETTETMMQDIIEREFAHHTVVSVMHRLRYIDRFDRVVVLKNGALVECDSPMALLQQDSELRGLYSSLHTAS